MAEITYAVARELDLQRSGIVRAIFAGRELLMGAEGSKREHPPGFLAEVLALGWRVLADEPGRELVMGGGHAALESRRRIPGSAAGRVCRLQ